MSLLRWAPGVHDDIQHLQLFTCTGKPRRRTAEEPTLQHRHDRWWEYEVQSALRSLQPPLSSRHVLLLGWDGATLAAVSKYVETDGPAQVELELMAIDKDHRFKGPGIADEMMRVTLQHIADRAVDAEVLEVFVSGQIWEANKYSQEMCERHDFAHTDRGASGVQVWTRWLLGSPEPPRT